MGARAAASSFRAAFDHSHATLVNWYPGHMATATRKLEEAMRHVDLVLEVRDARVPFSSSPGGRVEEVLRRTDSRVVVLNKSDLACPRTTSAVRDQLRRQGAGSSVSSVHLDARNVQDIQRLVKMLRARAKKAQAAAEFRTFPFRIAVVGVPNTGKSTLLNGLRRSATGRGGRVAKTGDTPGVTKHLSYSRVSDRPPIVVLDTPGIMPPGNLAPEVGLAVALTGGVAVRRSLRSSAQFAQPEFSVPLSLEKAQRFSADSFCCVLLDQDKLLDMGLLADFLLFHLNRQGAECQEAYCRRYAIREPIDDIVTVLVRCIVPAAALALVLALLAIRVDDTSLIDASLQRMSKF